MPRTELPIPADVDAEMDRLELTVSGPNGSVTRRLWYPDISVSVDGDTVVLETAAEDAKTLSTLGTFESHVENMFHGVTEGWEYEMELYYNHFPMQVSVEDGTVVIENFIGERAPRTTAIHGDHTEVEIDEETLYIRGPDKEAVGQTAADIEQLTRVSGKDVRVFQDGIYITNKPDKGGV